MCSEDNSLLFLKVNSSTDEDTQGYIWVKWKYTLTHT